MAERRRTLALVLHACPVKLRQTQRKFRQELSAAMKPILIIANEAYSSWSFRPWILMRHFGVAFDEIVIPLAQENIPARKCSVIRSPANVLHCSIVVSPSSCG